MSSKLFPALILVCLLVGCQSSAWRKVKEQNTVFSYENFLKKYPDGTYSDKAREALQFLEWEEEGKKGSEQAFREFIEKYPKSEFQGVARRLKEEAALKAVEKKQVGFFRAGSVMSVFLKFFFKRFQKLVSSSVRSFLNFINDMNFHESNGLYILS